MEDSEEHYSPQEILGDEDLKNRRTLGVLVDAQHESISRRLAWMRDSVERTFDQEKAVRKECRELEQKLGINTEEGRTLEASLFVDVPFLQVATLRGDEHPEELFGLDAWKGWLSARVAMREIDELNIENIQQVHELLAEGMPEQIRGRFRNKSTIGSDYTNIGSPILFTDSQISTIQDNSLLNVRLLDEQAKEGFIVYPTVDDKASMDKCLETLSPIRKQGLRHGATTDRLVSALIEENLEWYQQASQNLRGEDSPRHRTSMGEKDERLTPSELAAEFQRRIVSIHPFEDGNGRLSRLIMAWVLEKHGQNPTILRRGEDDLFFPDNEWAQEVKEGQKRYEELKGGITGSRFISASQFLHGHQKQAYFDILYRPTHEPPEPDKPMRHVEYRTYLEDFEQTYGTFAEYAEGRFWFGWGKSKETKMGGLIPEGYINVWGNTKPDVQKRIREVYLDPERKVYRGGVCDDIQDPKDLLNMFIGPTGFTSAYRPIILEGASPVSIQRIPKNRIRQELDSYNAVLMGDVVKNVAEGINVPQSYTKILQGRKTEDDNLARSVKLDGDQEKRRRAAMDSGRYTEYELSVHTGGKAPQLWVSSGISTSMDEDASRGFLTGLTPTKTEQRRALMVTGSLPRQGIFYSPSLYSLPLTKEFDPWEGSDDDDTLNREAEIVIMGGMDPNSIETVEMYDSDGRNLLAVAHRNSNNHIVLVDLATSEKSIYDFTRKGGLRLLGTRNLNEDELQTLRNELGKGAVEQNYSYSSYSTLPTKPNNYEEDDNPYDYYYDDEDGEDESQYLDSTTLAKLKTSNLFLDDDDDEN